MYRHWLLFRDHITLCEDASDFELEIIFELDASYTSENRFILATADGQNILFDSLEDHAVAALIFDVETLLVDLCLPRDQSYVLAVRDEGGDGFVDGTVEVYFDRVLVGRVSGNFGDLQVVEIDAEGITVETPVPSEPTPSPTLAPTQKQTEQPTLSPTSTPSTEPTSAKPTTIPIRATLPPFLGGLIEPSLGPVVQIPAPTSEPTQTPGSASSSEVDLDILGASNATTLSLSTVAGVVVLLCIFFS